MRNSEIAPYAGPADAKVAVVEFFDDCAEELSVELEAKGVEFSYSNFVEQEVMVIADAEQIKRAVNNIVSNSLKYMAPGRQKRINLRVKDVGDFIQVELEDNGKMKLRVEYTKQDREEYLRNLQKAFNRNKWINVTFSEIGDNGETGGCGGITQSQVDKTKYGVRLHQKWQSSSYNDEGYLFLLWEFPENGKSPVIHVRTWQPEWVGNVRQKPDDNILSLGGFDL